MVFLGVAVLGPVIARPVSRAIAWPLPRLRGTVGTLARENAARNPRRTASTAAALMIGVALVGFITIFASSIKASFSASIDKAFRADYVVRTKGSGGPPGGGGFSPDLARQICNGWKADYTVASLVLRAVIGRLCAQLAGWPGARLAQDNIVWKPPGAKPLGFHQDDSYNEIGRAHV